MKMVDHGAMQSSKSQRLIHFLQANRCEAWMMAEWFNSDFEWSVIQNNGLRNAFQLCFGVSPENAPRLLTRTQWSIFRRINFPNGHKMRRFSTAYLAQEREKLYRESTVRPFPDIGTMVLVRSFPSRQSLVKDSSDFDFRKSWLRTGIVTGLSPHLDLVTVRLEPHLANVTGHQNHSSEHHVSIQQSCSNSNSQSNLMDVISFDMDAPPTTSYLSSGLLSDGLSLLPCTAEEVVPLEDVKTLTTSSACLNQPPSLLREVDTPLASFRMDTDTGFPGVMGDLDCDTFFSGFNSMFVSPESPTSAIKVNANLPSTVNSLHFIKCVVRFQRVLELKQKLINRLAAMNDEVAASIAHSTDSSIVSPQFQHTYATTVVHLDMVNKSLKPIIDEILSHTIDIGLTHGMEPLSTVIDWRQRCDDEAAEILARVQMDLSSGSGMSTLPNERNTVLIHRLLTLLVELKELLYSQHKHSPNHVTMVQETLVSTKNIIFPVNEGCFNCNVENPVELILQKVRQTHMPAPSEPPPVSQENLPLQPVDLEENEQDMTGHHEDDFLRCDSLV